MRPCQYLWLNHLFRGICKRFCKHAWSCKIHRHRMHDFMSLWALVKLSDRKCQRDSAAHRVSPSYSFTTIANKHGPERSSFVSYAHHWLHSSCNSPRRDYLVKHLPSCWWCRKTYFFGFGCVWFGLQSNIRNGGGRRCNVVRIPFWNSHSPSALQLFFKNTPWVSSPHLRR